MNLFFWLLVLALLFVVWLSCRKFFIKIGTKVDSVVEDTKNILNYKGEDEYEQ